MYILTESFKQLDPIYYFDTDSDYFDILSACWLESVEKCGGLTVPTRVEAVIPLALARICDFIVHGLHPSHKISFLLLFVIRAVYANIEDEELGEVMFALSEFVHEFDEFDTEDDPDWDEDSRDLFSVRLQCFLKALKIKYDSDQQILQGIIAFMETEFRRNKVLIILVIVLYQTISRSTLTSQGC